MPTATKTPITSRRAVLAAAPGLILAATRPVAAAARPDDAELLIACARFDELERVNQASFAGVSLADEDRHNAMLEPLHAEQGRLLERLVELRATTLAGLRARARTLVTWDEELEYANSPYWDDRMLQALLRDLMEQV